MEDKRCDRGSHSRQRSEDLAETKYTAWSTGDKCLFANK